MQLNQFNDPQLEADVLGSIIANEEASDLAMAELDIECFWNSKNKLIFRAIYNLWKNNEPIDVTTVTNELRADLDKVPMSYISSVIESGLGSAGIKTKCKKLIGYKKRFEAFKLYEKMGKMFEGQAPLRDIVYEVSKTIESINDFSDKNNLKAGALFESRIEALKERINNGGAIVGLSTGYEELDNVINGLKKQEMIVIAGRPGMGKSTLANNIAINLVKKKQYVTLINFEMSKEQVSDKMLSCITTSNYNDFAKGNITLEEYKEISHSTQEMTDTLNEYFDLIDTQLSIDSIISYCRIMSKKKKLNVLIIDYLQLIPVNSNKDSREQQIAHISRTLKQLSKELNITVVALAQLSRAVEQRADHRPMLSDLRESGSIEADSDVVIMCYRDEYYNKDTEDKFMIEAIICKNRSGETKTVKLAWIPEYQRIGNIDRIFNDKTQVQEKAPF